jgi:hypothetical protein
MPLTEQDKLGLGLGLGLGILLLSLLIWYIYLICNGVRDVALSNYISSLLSPQAFNDFQNGLLTPLLKAEIKNIKDSGRDIQYFWYATSNELTRGYIMSLQLPPSTVSVTPNIVVV